MGKKVLVIGQGAREHAIAWKLSKSPEVEKVYAAPGNAGIAGIADCFDISVDDFPELIYLAESRGIDLTVVGPEVPLTLGIVEAFEARNLKIFGPRSDAARIEGSKVFAKNLMKKYGIPTADFVVFENLPEARAYVREKGAPIVIKADGLAAGKGVVVAGTLEEADSALFAMLENQVFGEAGQRVVIEECLSGQEVSVFAICDGHTALFMAAAQDHKRVYDGDKGPNTGGMGAYSPPPVYTPELHEQVMREIIQPTVKALEAEGCPYKGILYAGLMITEKGPRVLEFNARLGDPEAQVVLPLLEGDLLPLLEAAVEGRLNEVSIRTKDQTCVCVVLASGGYPGSYEKGHLIEGLEKLSPETLVFHAGTRRVGSKLVTDGGRVLSIVTLAPTIMEAVNKVYREIPLVHFEGMHYRRDIAARALK